jgi:hypothetical protein
MALLGCSPLENPIQLGVANSNQWSSYVKKTKFSESQIAAILKEAELSAKVGETCRKHGESEPPTY